jgi:3-amino-4-hydroxybenzoic acid synthase
MSREPTTKQCWLDIRTSGALKPVLCEEALHRRLDAIVADDAADLAALPPTISRVLAPAGDLPADLGAADLIMVDPRIHDEPAELARRHPGRTFGGFYEVTDQRSLDVACAGVRGNPFSVLRFADPTHIPLEIVLAAADGAAGLIITVAGGLDDARVQLGVLERGPDGLLLAPAAPGDAGRLKDVAEQRSPRLDLVTLTVTGTTHAGTGERACVDTCTYLGRDEGILVGSRSRAMVLCVSETHPLPYMPTRPFRVNAGAIMSYTLAAHDRTRYLSELEAGGTVLAVRSDGRTRRVTVGRVKIETRPLLSIDAVAATGERVNLIVQDDWHVRILGPGAAVLNSTALRPGDDILGYLPGRDRHVGYPIDELCYEQ